MVERSISKCEGLPSGLSGVGGYRYSPDKYERLDSAIFKFHCASFGGVVGVVLSRCGSQIDAVVVGLVVLVCLGNIYVWTRLSLLNSRMLSGCMLHLMVEENSGPTPPRTLDFFFGDASQDDWIEIDREQKEKSRIADEVCSNVA